MLNKLLFIAIFLFPLTVSAAILTWDEYYDFVGVINHELSYDRKIPNVKGNLLTALMSKAEKRTPLTFENYYDGNKNLKLRTGNEYASRRTELFDKIRGQLK